MLALTSPIETPYHRMGVGVKLASLCLFTVLLFWVDTPWIVTAADLAVATLYLAAGRSFATTGARHLKPVLPFIAVIFVWHVATSDPEGAFLISARLLAALGFANLVTMTTRLDAMVDTGTRLLAPLRAFGLNTALIALSVALVVRFIPVLMVRSAQLLEAWRGRSPRRPKWHILMPVFLTTIEDAEHVAEALRARGGVHSNL